MLRIALLASTIVIASAVCQPEPEATKEERVHNFVLLAERFRPIEDVLNDFHDAASKADFKRYFSHWTDSSVFLGTDSWERWTGQEFRDFAKPYFDQGQGWTYTVKERHADFSPDGNVAWFDEMLENAKLGTCRGSGVLVKTGDDWKIMQYNLSMPIPNEMIEGVAKEIAERKKGK